MPADTVYVRCGSCGHETTREAGGKSLVLLSRRLRCSECKAKTPQLSRKPLPARRETA